MSTLWSTEYSFCKVNRWRSCIRIAWPRRTSVTEFREGKMTTSVNKPRLPTTAPISFSNRYWKSKRALTLLSRSPRCGRTKPIAPDIRRRPSSRILSTIAQTRSKAQRRMIVLIIAVGLMMMMMTEAVEVSQSVRRPSLQQHISNFHQN